MHRFDSRFSRLAGCPLDFCSPLAPMLSILFKFGEKSLHHFRRNPTMSFSHVMFALFHHFPKSYNMGPCALTCAILHQFLPCGAMRKRGLCCRPVSIHLSRWCIVSTRLRYRQTYLSTQ